MQAQYIIMQHISCCTVHIACISQRTIECQCTLPLLCTKLKVSSSRVVQLVKAVVTDTSLGGSGTESPIHTRTYRVTREEAFKNMLLYTRKLSSTSSHSPIKCTQLLNHTQSILYTCTYSHSMALGILYLYIRTEELCVISMSDPQCSRSRGISTNRPNDLRIIVVYCYEEA